MTTATLDLSSLTLTADIQAALNSLSSIVAVGGSVTVSPVNAAYVVTFGGALTPFLPPPVKAALEERVRERNVVGNNP